LIFWGPGWGTATRDSHGDLVFTQDRYNGAGKLQELFKGLGTGGERWSGVLTQYCEGVAVGATACPNTSPHVAYPTGGALESVLYDIRPVPVSPTADQIAAEAEYAAMNFANTTAAANRNTQYVILSPTGSHPDGFGLPGAHFCAWHAAVNPGYGPISFTNLPYTMDLGAQCGMGYLNGQNGALDGYTIDAAHEYAESLTDPSPTSGWSDPTLGNEGETADKCPPPLIAIGRAAPVNVTLTTGTFVLPATWSNDTLGCETAHTILPILTVVPDVHYDTLTTASRLLSAAGLVTGTVSKVVDCNFLGIVRDQNPTGGLTVPAGTPVNLTVGGAPKPPHVCG
jgi:serine protease